MKSSIFFIILFLLLLGYVSQAQEEKELPLKGSHQIAFMISHSHSSQGINEEGNRQWIIMPSLALDYNYWIANRWAIGIHSDLIVETFKVEDENKNELERTVPLASVLAACFKPNKHNMFMVGLGGEFAKEGNFVVSRLGYEFAVEIRNNWELSAGLNYDIKWNAYDTWVLGLGISKIFRKKKSNK